jgi:hypothetical protein
MNDRRVPTRLVDEAVCVVQPLGDVREVAQRLVQPERAVIFDQTQQRTPLQKLHRKERCVSGRVHARVQHAHDELALHPARDLRFEL